MFVPRVRSALFIDFENVGSICSPDRIADWLAWIEAGAFDDGRRRKLVEKRVYWNPSHQKYEDIFEGHGFEIILCEKFQYLKNGADIRIALDVMEAIHRPRHVDELILFAQDTDYVPVLQRLETKKVRSAILVDERQDRIYAIYDLHADVTIPIRVFKEDALNYRRPRPLQQKLNSFKQFFGGARAGPQVSETRPSALKPQQSSAAVPQPAKLDPLGLALRAVLRVTSLKPNHFTAREAIERELRKISDFRTRGQNAFLGFGSYQELMRECARRSNKLSVHAAGGGVSVKYLPDEGEYVKGNSRIQEDTGI